MYKSLTQIYKIVKIPINTRLKLKLTPKNASEGPMFITLTLVPVAICVKIPYPYGQ